MYNVKVLEKIVKQKDEFYSELNKVIIGQHDVVEYIFIFGEFLLGIPSQSEYISYDNVWSDSNVVFFNGNKL